MDESIKRIVLVIPSLHTGGMERVMSELARYFASKSFLEVHVLLYGIRREIFYSLPCNIYIHKPPFEFNNSYRIINSIKTLRFLRKKIHALKPDTVLSFGEYWNSFVLLALMGSKVPVFVSDRCQPDKNLGRLHEFLRKYLYPNAAGIIAQTEIAKSIYIKKRLNSNISVIGNPIRMFDNEGRIEKENIILSVGRLIKTKHHDELIKLFVKINKAGWKLVIVGDDALRQNNMQLLQSLIDELGVKEKVMLAGKQSDVESFYCMSRIFAFTSSSEGFPNVVGEAQSAGLPVVAFDCTGPSEMVTDGENGFLVPVFDYSLFEKRLEKLMENQELISGMGENARLSVRKFSIESIGLSFETFILNTSI